jgi:hypothetical protein
MMTFTRIDPSEFNIPDENFNQNRAQATEEYLKLYMPSRTQGELIVEFQHYKGSELDQLTDVELKALLASDFPNYSFTDF